LTVSKVDIRPGVSVLAVLRHLNYKPWFALGEFVDNSVESFIKNQENLLDHHGKDYRLLVDIDIDHSSPARISIRDNAAGINESEYERAFRPAAIPNDRNGLAEFGMGMKSAACWFAPQWSVRTSAFNEPVSRLIHFDIKNIIDDKIEELSIHEKKELPESHYTEVVLESIFHVPVKRTISKLKEHLTDIYRAFIRQDLLILRFNGEVLCYNEPSILKAPYYKNIDETPKRWHKEIEFDFGEGLSVNGFAALRKTANTAKAGFSLFRRGRVIQGSGDEGYRPGYIFGSSNSYRYQRLFGELHLKGFEVSHTKDGFRWDENEQPFLELLREHLDSEDMPLLKQAEGHRVRASKNKIKKAAKKAVQSTTSALEEKLPDVIESIAEAILVDTPNEEVPHDHTIAKQKFEINYRGKEWSINVELTDDESESQWLSVTDVAERRDVPRKLDIRVSMVHPFMVRFAQTDIEDLDALLRVAAALALAEVVARDSGVRRSGTIRRNLNNILRDALSEP
jgi:hypothetical protein